MSAVVKHSITIRGHRTSYSVEAPFQEQLEKLARSRDMSVAALVAEIDATRPEGANLSSAIRLRILQEVLSDRG